MKKIKWPPNMGLKFAALLFAIFFWLAVVNIADPVESTSFNDIPVEMINEEVVTSKGKIYSLVDGPQSVRVTVSAKRSILARISSSNISATADLSQMEVKTCLVPITAEVRGINSSAILTDVNVKNIQVEIEDVTRNIFPISVNVTGTPRDGYVVGEMTTNPEKITIRGPEKAIGNIQKVVAKVDVSGKYESDTLDAELIIYDGNGNPMDQSQLTHNLGEQGLSVNVQMLNTKNVKLSVGISGTPASGFVYTGYTCEPSQVQICGTREELADVDEIAIPDSEVNIDKERGRKEITVDILKYLPEGVSLVDEAANNVLVTVMIEPEGIKTIMLPVEAVQINNMQENFRLLFESEMDLELQFTGEEKALEVLDIRYAASIDLREYKVPGSRSEERRVGKECRG